MSKKRREDRPAILVPIDFSDHSAAALVWAAEAARRFEADLKVLHVVHDPESAPGYYAQTKRKKHLNRLEEAAEEMMEEFLESVRKEHPELAELQDVDEVLVIGIPVSRILEMAEKTDAMMIVMGSLGRTGLGHLLLGSKAERIAQLSPIPVTVVKAKDKGSKKKGRKE